MKQRTTRHTRDQLSYPTLLLLLILLLSLTACGQAAGSSLSGGGTPTAPPPDLPLTAATVVGVSPAPTLTAGAAATLTVAEIVAEINTTFATAAASNTRAALTTIPAEQTALAGPTPNPYDWPTPWRTSAPEPTPVVGQQQECSPGIHGFNPSNCWVVLLNNEYLHVNAGYLYNDASGDLSDTTIGVIVVFDAGIERYPTPQRRGPMHIAAVDGTRVTVIPDDPQAHVTFVFDLLTRQWIDATPGPSPVPSALPPTP